MKHIQYCVDCKQYTMKQQCLLCDNATQLARPPKYSIPDKYGQYRRKIKEEERKASGKLS